MNTTPAALQAHSDNTRTIGESDLLPRHPIFYTRDLEHARKHLGGVFVENSLAYLPRERGLDFRHRQAKLGLYNGQFDAIWGWHHGHRP